MAMKKLIQRIRCRFGHHDNERLPSPPGIMHGIFGPHRCRCCGHSEPGFPMLDFSDLIQRSEKGDEAMSEDRKQLLTIGKRLFGDIGDDLNALDARPAEEFRRESDFEEICIALALHSQKDPRYASPAANLEVFRDDDRQGGPI